jgi:hypothetical protein
MTIDWIGWVATAIFVSSYACKDPVALRRIQALAAVLWVAYGMIIPATPVVVANLLVAGIAVYSSLTKRMRGVSPASERDLSRTSLPCS